MSYATSSLNKLTAVVVAMVATVGVHGTILAGFDKLAASAVPTHANAPCKAMTLPTVQVVHARS